MGLTSLDPGMQRATVGVVHLHHGCICSWLLDNCCNVLILHYKLELFLAERNHTVVDHGGNKEFKLAPRVIGSVRRDHGELFIPDASIDDITAVVDRFTLAVNCNYLRRPGAAAGKSKHLFLSVLHTYSV